MPAKNIIKIYREDSYYHVYSRGVAKQAIFLDEIDYKVFLSYLQIYLTPPNILQGSTLKSYPSKQLKNYHQEITLLAYCLMSNHFHLLIHQKSPVGIADFMRSLLTKYAMYFNKRYMRVGPLFQSSYKAVRMETDEQLLYVSRYIHVNPDDYLAYPYSSCKNYIGIRNQPWLNTYIILDYFKSTNQNNSYALYLNQSDENGIFSLADEEMSDFRVEP